MNLQAVHDELTTFFLAETLRQGCTVLTHQTMSKQAYDLKLLDAVLALIEQGGYADVPAVAVYHSAFKALSGENQTQKNAPGPEQEGNFEKLKALIRQVGNHFPQPELRDIYLLAINFCIKRLNRGEEMYIREAFELYRSGLENNALLENGILSGYTYKNVARLGVALGEHDWVANFIENFKKHLPAKERENTWRYTLASFHFQSGRYGEAMMLLRQVEFKDVLNNLDARRMLLRSYFELREFTALDSLLDTFQAYIRRQKDIGYHRENYLNLIKFVRQRMELNSSDTIAILALKKEIEKTNNVAEKAWLQERVGL